MSAGPRGGRSTPHGATGCRWPQRSPVLPRCATAWQRGQSFIPAAPTAAHRNIAATRVPISVVALLAIRFTPLVEGTRRSEAGYFHGVVLHPDGMAEDSWGKASLAAIASRFGVIEFKVSSDEHRAVIAKIQTSSSARYDGALQDARSLIRAHRLR